MTGNRVLGFFLVASIILIPLGAAILHASLTVVEYKVRYDNAEPLSGTNKTALQLTLLSAPDDTGIPQTVSITTSKTMNPPVRVSPHVHAISVPIAQWHKNSC